MTDDTKRVRILSQNIRSMNKGFPKLKHYINSQTNTFDILLLQELWKTRGSSSLNGYNDPIIKEREASRGGGVGIWGKKAAKLEILPTEVNIFDEGNYESIAVRIVGNIGLINCYRPPKGSLSKALSYIEKQLYFMREEKLEIILMGDLNLNMNKISQETEKLLKVMDGFNLDLIVTENTRMGTSKGTLIDHVFCDANTVHSCEVTDTGISDHCGIEILLAKQIETPKLQSRRFNFKESNINKVKQELTLIYWDKFFEGLNVNSATHKLEKELTRQLEKHCLNKGNRLTEKVPFDKNLRKMRNKLRKLRRGKDDPEIREEYKVLKRKYEAKVRRQIKCHEKKLLDEKNPRKLWENIRELTDTGKDKSNDYSKIANPQKTFLEFFKNIPVKTREKIPNSTESPLKYMKKVTSDFKFQIPTPNEVFDLLKKIQPKRSSGWDGISSWLVRELRVVLLGPLHTITSLMIKESKFPEAWKIAKVIPLYKKGKKGEVNNYRPISLLPCLSKIAEKVLTTQIYAYMENNRLFPHAQYGFRKCKSTTQALLNVIYEVEALKKAKAKYAIILMDFSKAFDVIHHGILYKKLKNGFLHG